MGGDKTGKGRRLEMTSRWSMARPSTRVNLRLFGFAASMTLLAGLIPWAGYAAWQGLQQVRQNFGAVRSHSFHLAEHLETSIRDLNECALHFDFRKAPEDKSRFLALSARVQRWLRSSESSVTTAAELDLLKQIKAAFPIYIERTTEFLERSAPVGAAADARPPLEQIAGHSEPFLDLCRKLRTAEGEALNRFVASSHQAVNNLQWLLVAFVALVAILGFAATRLIYRTAVSPLRAKLVESRAMVERQEKLASLGTLAAGVAHEIRNPLTAINVRLHSLRRTLLDGSSEHDDVMVIDQEIKRLDRIVRDFLDFGRPADPRFSTIPAESLLTRIQELLAPQWHKSAIRLEIEPAPAAWIRADLPQLEQVLINLIQNAADSIERDGSITLRIRENTARLGGKTRPVVIVEVTDTGNGIAPEVQKRIFDPFFTTKETGNGLGLAIAARIVEKHGGALQYRTEVNRGTTFGVVLPRAEKLDDEDEA